MDTSCWIKRKASCACLSDLPCMAFFVHVGGSRCAHGLQAVLAEAEVGRFSAENYKQPARKLEGASKPVVFA